ncbi:MULTISPECIES: hypothetical protein [unclassified Cyanobium]|uniref:hypothetical protein n=1 Tax=unclassified Cyanobium TaxID=2627006 RepID=UPI0020CD7B05|nr:MULTISPECIES: hypothetical protein [unclassified Cyanobium]MCP9860038.1 hypothetical protein [Cyanobium sp. Cruz-8H5]MCP9867249.1 hypothetical protein [Cyanobium sp. Cruz-8D1]
MRLANAMGSQRIQRELRLIIISVTLFLAHQAMESILLHWFASNGYSDLCQLDCHWYRKIAGEGYERLQLGQFDYSRMANVAFFPLFPGAASVMSHLLGLTSQTGVVLTSKFFFMISIYAFIKMVQTIAPSTNPITNGSIAAFNPYSIYGNAGYTEPLFLLLTCIFFALLERRLYLKASIAGALLSATRLVGVVSVISYLISLTPLWPSWRWKNRFQALGAMALIPTGLVVFMLHLQERTGDPLAFIHIQRAWGRATPAGPTSWLVALSKALSSDWWLYRYWGISGIVVLLISLFFILRGRYTSLASFSLFSTIIPLTSDCWGLSRYIWWQAPVLLFIALFFGRNRALLAGWLTLAIAVNVWSYRLWFSTTNWHLS